MAESLPGDFYTPAEAERLLSRTDKPISERRIRQMLQSGELEGERDGRNRWHVAQHEVHRLMQERRTSTPEIGDSGSSGDVELLEAIRQLERSLGRAEARAELTEKAESTLREQLDRERERSDRLEAELRESRERLEAESRRGFWRRLFGG